MPKFTFHCPSCETKETCYSSIEVSSKPCKCGDTMVRSIPTVSKPIVKERVDEYSNVNLPVDNKEELEERKLTHYWEVVVPRLVQQYPVEHCLREGWMTVDERGQIVVQTKPPHKR